MCYPQVGSFRSDLVKTFRRAPSVAPAVQRFCPRCCSARWEADESSACSHDKAEEWEAAATPFLTTYWWRLIGHVSSSAAARTWQPQNGQASLTGGPRGKPFAPEGHNTRRPYTQHGKNRKIELGVSDRSCCVPCHNQILGPPLVAGGTISTLPAPPHHRIIVDWAD